MNQSPRPMPRYDLLGPASPRHTSLSYATGDILYRYGGEVTSWVR